MKIKKINVHLTEEQIEQRVRELGAEISKVYGDEPVCLICILKGSVFFTCELAKRITSPVEIEFMSVSSYGSGTSSSGVVRIVNDLGTSIEGKPLSNLDAKLRTQMRVELAALQHAVGTTTIYVTHDQTEAMTLGTRIVVMRDGKMQQVDTPANLYAKPVNRFVAGFIGTPSMNFFEAQVVSWEEAPALLVGEYRMMPCREDAARISRHGSDSVILGIRPENILWEAPECVSAGADYVEAMILEVELLGAEKLLFFLLYGKKYVAKIPAEYDARAGEVRRLYFDVTAIHLFDCDSEMRI